jgi:hypothetical protein
MLWKAPTPAGGYFLKINNKQPTLPSLDSRPQIIIISMLDYFSKKC